MFRSRGRVNHDSLIKAALLLGYEKVNKKGLCKGTAYRGIQAILLNKVKDLDVRALKIELATNRPAYGATLTPADILDIKAFIEGVIIFQDPQKYAELFSEPIFAQESNRALDMLSPSLLDKKPQIEALPEVCHIFTNVTLSSLLEKVKDNVSLTNQPVAFVIEGFSKNEGHDIAIGYDPAVNTWYLIDANQMPTLTSNDIKLLVEEIEKIYGDKKNNEIILGLRPFAINQPLLKDLFSQFQEEIKPEVSLKSVHSQKILLKLATEMHLMEISKNLLEKDVLKNQPDIEIESDILRYLAAADDIKMMNQVLPYIQYGGEKNEALIAAIQQTHQDMCLTLIEHGADVDMKIRGGEAILDLVEDSAFKQLLIDKAELEAKKLLTNIKQYIITHNWEVRFWGGEKIKLNETKEIIVPKHVKNQWGEIGLAESGQKNWRAAAQEVIRIAATVSESKMRKEDTREYFKFFRCRDFEVIENKLTNKTPKPKA